MPAGLLVSDSTTLIIFDMSEFGIYRLLAGSPQPTGGNLSTLTENNFLLIEVTAKTTKNVDYFISNPGLEKFQSGNLLFDIFNFLLPGKCWWLPE